MKISIRYGLIYAVLSILWTLLMFVTGLNRSESINTINLLATLITIVCCVLAVKEYRKLIGNGYILFGQAFRQALAVCVIGGIISVAFYAFVYLTVIDPSYLEWMNEQQYVRMEEMGMSEQAIEAAVIQSARFMKPAWFFTFGIAGSLFIGAVVALIVAAVLKKPNPYEIS